VNSNWEFHKAARFGTERENTQYSSMLQHNIKSAATEAIPSFVIKGCSEIFMSASKFYFISG
jgi:hypothetical protein